MERKKVYESDLVKLFSPNGNGVEVGRLKDAGLDGTITAAPVYKNEDGNYRTDGILPDGYSWVNYAGQVNDPAYVEQNRGSWGNADNAWTSDEDWNAIQSYKQQYEQAKAAGDTAGMDAAHAAAEKLRAQYGYSGGAAGDAYLPTMAYTGVYSLDDDDGGGYGSGGYGSSGYLSRYQARIDALADAILNRDPFSYDKEQDPLYQQYKDTYTRAGQRGMQDTLAQVSARTGGLASSYAESAAQQTYNNYMAQLADKVPELYQLAYSMYMDDLTQDRNDLSMLMGLDDTAYGRWSDDRNFGYNAYRDQVADRQWQQQFDYNASRDQVADSQWQTQFDYQKAQDALAQQNWQTQWDYQLQQDALAREDALKKLTSGGKNNNNNNNKTDNQSILNTIYGMDSEDEVYDYLVGRGLNNTQTENYMNLYSEHKAEMDRQSSATVENRSDADGVTISRLGKVSWSRLAQLVEEGKVKEVYDPENNSYWYQWVEK